jgi:Effector-associated domain 11
MTKSEFIQTTRQYIADGKTDEALELFRQRIAEYDNDLLTDATLLQSRFQTAYSGFVIKNILPREDFDRTQGCSQFWLVLWWL